MSEAQDTGSTDPDDALVDDEFDHRTGVDDRKDTRAALLPEERAAGSADPEAQAREVLRDSEIRTEHPAPDEHRPAGP